MFEEDQYTKVPTNQNEEPPEHTVRRSNRTRIESKRLSGYEGFLDKLVDADGGLIEEAMMMVDAKPINLDQAINDSNWLVATERRTHDNREEQDLGACRRVNKEAN